MCTKIYFVKHGEVNASKNNVIKKLSKKGEEQAKRIANRFKNCEVSRIISSPYLRSVETVNEIAEDKGVKLELVNDFNEREVSENQDEVLKEIQKRSVEAINKVLEESVDENVIISTHSETLKGILSYFDKSNNYTFTKEDADIFELTFDNKDLKRMEHINIEIN